MPDVLARCEGSGIPHSWAYGGSADSTMPPSPWLYLPSYVSGPVPLAALCHQLWVTGHQPCALPWHCCAQTHRRSRAISQGTVEGSWCPAQDGQSHAVLSSRMRAGVGQVPAELAPPLLGHCNQSVAQGLARLSHEDDVLLLPMKAILSHSEASLLCHQLWSQAQSPSIQNMALSNAQAMMTLNTTGQF